MTFTSADIWDFSYVPLQSELCDGLLFVVVGLCWRADEKLMNDQLWQIHNPELSAAVKETNGMWGPWRSLS